MDSVFIELFLRLKPDVKHILVYLLLNSQCFSFSHSYCTLCCFCFFSRTFVQLFLLPFPSPDTSSHERRQWLTNLVILCHSFPRISLVFLPEGREQLTLTLFVFLFMCVLLLFSCFSVFLLTLRMRMCVCVSVREESHEVLGVFFVRAVTGKSSHTLCSSIDYILCRVFSRVFSVCVPVYQSLWSFPSSSSPSMLFNPVSWSIFIPKQSLEKRRERLKGTFHTSCEILVLFLSEGIFLFSSPDDAVSASSLLSLSSSFPASLFLSHLSSLTHGFLFWFFVTLHDSSFAYLIILSTRMKQTMFSRLYSMIRIQGERKKSLQQSLWLSSSSPSIALFSVLKLLPPSSSLLFFFCPL